MPTRCLCGLHKREIWIKLCGECGYICGESQEQILRIRVVRIQAVFFQKSFLECMIFHGAFQVVQAAVVQKTIV